MCFICGKEYAGGPDRIRGHLDGGGHVKACTPNSERKQRHKEVVAVLRQREKHTQQLKEDKKKKDAAERSAKRPDILCADGGSAV